jgi:hypothetical protein
MHCKHRDITSPLHCSPILLDIIFQLGNDASNAFTIEKGKECVLGPFLDEIAVGVDGVGFRKFLLYHRYDGLQILLVFESSIFDAVSISYIWGENEVEITLFGLLHY